MIKNSIVIVICLTLFSFSKVSAQHTEQSTKYGLHGKLVAQEGKGSDLAQILLDAASLLENAKGCHLYVVGIDQNNPDEVWITEIWETKEDHDNSLRVPEVRALIGKAMPILNGNPEKGQEWNILGGTGIE